MLSKFWYVPYIAIGVLLLILTLQRSSINNLRQDNKELSDQVEAFRLKAESNQAKAKAYDEDIFNNDQRHFQDAEFKKVIRNDPKSETSAISNVMHRALEQLPRPSAN